MVIGWSLTRRSHRRPTRSTEKAIVDAQAVGEAVRRAVKRAGARAKEVAVAISGDAAITRSSRCRATCARPNWSPRSRCRPTSNIPFPMEEVSFDFEVVGPSEKDPEMLDVLLVATRSENVDSARPRVQAAGLAARIVDVEAFALENACRLLTHQMPDGGIGPQHRGDRFRREQHDVLGAPRPEGHLYARLRVRRAAAHEEIMRTYGLSMEEAGRAKKEGGLPANYQAEVLDPFIDDMCQQVSRSLQFYLASGSGREQPEQVLICGGCANIPGVADVIASRVGIPAERGDPLGQMKISTRALAQGVKKDATALLTACGLALRSFD